MTKGTMIRWQLTKQLRFPLVKVYLSQGTMVHISLISCSSDGSRVEAQTPDGTRVTTPNPTKPNSTVPTPRGTLGTRASYAAALKTKPSDWHLEFSMDDHKLPLDLTIYGAIHQHEARKKAGHVITPSMIWQNVYSVKFKKVPGPAPTSEGTYLSVFPGPLLTFHLCSSW